MRKKLFLFSLGIVFMVSLSACNEKDGMISEEKEVQDQADDEKVSDDNRKDAQDASNDNTEETKETQTDVDSSIEEFDAVDLSAGGWNVRIDNYRRGTSLENISVELGYADAATNEFIQEAPEGYEYFLIKMTITKDGSKETIKWDNMLLTDSEGNTYNRCDDIFITDLGMKRMPGTDLNFGTKEGWIAFEIEEGAVDLTLQYEFEDEVLNYTF